MGLGSFVQSKRMSWTAKAALAAALLNCGLLTASADSPNSSSNPAGTWLKDGDCALFSTGATAGDSATWTGRCVDGYAEGLGTATFTHDGQSQSFTGIFVHGVIPDGHVITRWGQGWSYDGDTVDGRFNGAGILTTNTADRFEGVWTDGKMNGFGVLRRANGDRYAGDWKDDRPNGKGELRHADGTLVRGMFVDGKLSDAAAPSKAVLSTGTAGDSVVDSGGQAAAPSGAPFGAVSGKTLIGVDGSSIALTLIEGGMELQVVPTDGTAKKTTFTFMTDRMGTVVEDSGSPSMGSSVTGFFRLTGKGVEIRYADGRSAMLSSGPEGGVQMALDGDNGSSCRAWYPAGHGFSDTEKKMALNAYATKLGLPVMASEVSNGCTSSPQPASLAPANPSSVSPPVAAAPSVAAPAAKTKLERHSQIKAPAKVKAAYHVGDYQAAATPKMGLESISVRPSEVHTVDEAIAVPSLSGAMAMAPPHAPLPSDRNDAGHCLKVDSDGGHWGFRNSCDFAVQFAYCMAGGDNSLSACGDSGAVTTSVAGSVAANGFGALMADTSLKEQDSAHNFRWVACAGGAGEVVAHLDRSNPPSGRCERPHTASN